VVVHSAGIQDRNRAKHALTKLISSFPGAEARLGRRWLRREAG
jgi:hypothetical protein